MADSVSIDHAPVMIISHGADSIRTGRSRRGMLRG
jgi:hypothetical protein